jgi:hypothetical protein
MRTAPAEKKQKFSHEIVGHAGDAFYLIQDLKNNPGAPIRLSSPPVALELPALVIKGERGLVAARCLFFGLRRAWWAREKTNAVVRTNDWR